ncbi:MAG TPA: PIN domain-containing protein [Thermoanaerobaculia bacterium]|nr:PIN domain-containing protein [Thermoanaerobaculia bacterium]
MKVLFDTNVVLDVLLDRHPFRDAAAELIARVERKELTGVLGATTLTTLYYLVAKASGKEAALSAVRDVLSLFHIAAVDKKVLSGAVESSIKDFEDAVLIEAGALEDVDAVVTRDPAGFQDGRLRVLSPQQLQAALG